MERDKFIILLASTVIAAFFGAFVASMVIFGDEKPNKILFLPHMIERPMKSGMHGEFNKDLKRNENLMKRQEEIFDEFDEDIKDDLADMKKSRVPSRGGFVFMNTGELKTLETKDMYKIIVDLEPFNDDIKNVDVKIFGNKITVSAKYKAEDKNTFSSTQIHQTIVLPAKIDVKAVKKHQEGDSLVIVIPKVPKK